MIFGFNTDVPGREGVYHVQTEDRGAKNPVVESIIYVGGKIMGRRRTPYPAEETKERIEEMVRRQHKDLVEAIRAGTWAPSGDGSPSSEAAASNGYMVELTNPGDVRHGEYLRFQFSVRDRAKNVPAAISLELRWLLGGEVAEKQSLQSRADGGAEVWLPRPAEHRYGTLLIRCHGPAGKELAKFHVHGSDID
jgi:hypothetical protein